MCECTETHPPVQWLSESETEGPPEADPPEEDLDEPEPEPEPLKK